MSEQSDNIFSLHYRTVSKTELNRVVQVDGTCDRCAKEFTIRSPKDAEHYLMNLATHISECANNPDGKDSNVTVGFGEAPRIGSGLDLNWTTVAEEASRILKMVDNAAYTPPESVDQHLKLVNIVCFSMDKITEALKIRTK